MRPDSRLILFPASAPLGHPSVAYRRTIIHQIQGQQQNPSDKPSRCHMPHIDSDR